MEKKKKKQRMVFLRWSCFCHVCVIKDEYEELRRRIEDAAAATAAATTKNSAFSNLIGEFPDFANSKPNNHPPIVKVMFEICPLEKSIDMTMLKDTIY